MQKGDFSKFHRAGCPRSCFYRTVQDIKARNADTGPDELQALLDNAVGEVRAERRSRVQADKARCAWCLIRTSYFRPPCSIGAPTRDLSRIAGGIFNAPICAELLELEELKATVPAIAARIKPYKAVAVVALTVEDYFPQINVGGCNRLSAETQSTLHRGAQWSG
jgi:hypothetical protein